MKHLCLAACALSFLLFAGCCNSNQSKSSSRNEVIDAIMARRSIRHYTSTPVDRSLLQQIAECGVNAPNAMNHQDWEVRIVDDQAYLDSLTVIMKKSMPRFIGQDDPKFRNAFRNATAIIAIASPAEDKAGMYLQNVGLMSENICLAAYSLGLGTCVMGGPAMFLKTNEEAKPYLDKLGFSEGYSLQVVIAVGYPDEAPEAKPRDLNKIKFVD